MSTVDTQTLSGKIKEKAYELGFDICGIAGARSLEEREQVIKKWCSEGMNSEMSYLARDIEKRINPEYLFPGAKSLIVTGLSYYTDRKQTGKGVPVISRYAYGLSYQNVIKDKLNTLLTYIQSIKSGSKGRSFSDTAPLLEKAWATEAGLGWQGKHSIVINRKIGSFFFIGILILNIELEYDNPPKGEYCGECRLCIELCPTEAINENRTIDARKCIANITIENREPVPINLVAKLGDRVYGCDRCQEVCPWNKDAVQHKNKEFFLSEEIEKMTIYDWAELSEENFKRLFKGSEIERKKYEPFMRNVTNVTNRNR
jgi:epoxyqueuosine reductase